MVWDCRRLTSLSRQTVKIGQRILLRETAAGKNAPHRPHPPPFADFGRPALSSGTLPPRDDVGRRPPSFSSGGKWEQHGKRKKETSERRKKKRSLKKVRGGRSCRRRCCRRLTASRRTRSSRRPGLTRLGRTRKTSRDDRLAAISASSPPAHSSSLSPISRTLASACTYWEEGQQALPTPSLASPTRATRPHEQEAVSTRSRYSGSASIA